LAMANVPIGRILREARRRDDHGGHFAAHKVPDLYASDMRAFFREIGR
jgi:hypothetical protein